MTATPPAPEPKWLTPHEQVQWRSYLIGVATLNEALQSVLHDSYKLSMSEYELMVRLSESPDRSMRMSQLARELVHSRSRVTYLVRAMEQRGLVGRCQAEGDGRGVTCFLTDAGWELLREAAKTHVASVREYFVDVVGPEAMSVIGQSMAQVAHAAGRLPPVDATD